MAKTRRGPKAASHGRVVYVEGKAALRPAFIGTARLPGCHAHACVGMLRSIRKHAHASVGVAPGTCNRTERGQHRGRCYPCRFKLFGKGTGTICARRPTGRSGKLNPSPFPFGLPGELGGLRARSQRDGAALSPPVYSRQSARVVSHRGTGLPSGTPRNETGPYARAKHPKATGPCGYRPRGRLFGYRFTTSL